MTLKDVEKKPLGTTTERIEKGIVTYSNYQITPNFYQLTFRRDYFGIFPFSIDDFKEKVLEESLSYLEKIKDFEEGIHLLADSVVRKWTDLDLRSGLSVGIEIKDENWKPCCRALTTAFNLGVVEIPDSFDLETLKKLNREIEEKADGLKVDFFVEEIFFFFEKRLKREKDRVKEVVTLTLKEILESETVEDALKKKVLERNPDAEVGVTVLRIFTPYYLEKSRQLPPFRFRGTEMPVPREIDCLSSPPEYREENPVFVNQMSLIRILENDLLRAGNKGNAEEVIRTFLDELVTALKDYYSKHPFNGQSRIEEKVIEVLKSRAYLWNFEVNEFDSAFEPPKDFTLVWEGESNLDSDTELKIYRHNRWPEIYFLSGEEPGMGGINFGAVLVGLTEEEIETLKNVHANLMRSLPLRANRVKEIKEGIFTIEAKYDPELGLCTKKFSPDEIAEMVALELNPDDKNPKP